MWKLLQNAWGYIVGRGRKKPHIEPAPVPVPVPTPVPVPVPTPAPVPASSFTALTAAGYLLPYANVPAALAADYPTAPTAHSVTLAMPTTGGREDLQKPLPDWQVRALLNGTSSNAWKQTLLNADAEKYFAWRIDDASGSPWNIDNAPNVTLDTRFPGAPISDPRTGLPGEIDDAHMPQLTYLTFLMATDTAEKERWLRVLQYQANWLMLRQSTNNGLGILAATQVRGFGHAMPILGMAAVATRLWESFGITPSRPLLSANYFDRKMENNNRRLDAMTIGAGPHLVGGVLMPAFHIYPPLQVIEYALWMSDMAAIGDGILVRLGFGAARARFEWAIRGIKDRLKSGFDWGGLVYKVNFQRPDGSIVMTWPDLWEQRVPGPDVPYDPSWDVNHITHGALCIAASLGDSEAAEMAQGLRDRGFRYAALGYFFDPAVRPVALTQPTVSPDPQFADYTITMQWN